MKYKVREIFEERKLSASELAMSLGIARVTASNYINENRKMSKATLAKIAEFLKLEVEDLIAPPDYDYVKPEKGSSRSLSKKREGVFLDALERATVLFRGHEGHMIERVRPPRGMDHHYDHKGNYIGCY